MGVWSSISRLVLGSDEEERRVMHGIRERKRQARYAAAKRLEQDGKRNIEDAAPGPVGTELREQGHKMLKQARCLRDGEISLLAAMNLNDGEDEALREVVERTVEGDPDMGDES